MDYGLKMTFQFDCYYQLRLVFWFLQLKVRSQRHTSGWANNNLMRGIFKLHFLVQSFQQACRIKFKAKAKFSDKTMMQCAIFKAGVSRQYLEQLMMLIFIPIKNCIPKLLDFIKLHLANNESMFWPDFTSCHCVHTTQ